MAPGLSPPFLCWSHSTQTRALRNGNGSQYTPPLSLGHPLCGTGEMPSLPKQCLACQMPKSLAAVMKGQGHCYFMSLVEH